MSIYLIFYNCTLFKITGESLFVLLGLSFPSLALKNSLDTCETFANDAYTDQGVINRTAISTGQRNL